jgi:hypothetical protein
LDLFSVEVIPTMDYFQKHQNGYQNFPLTTHAKKNAQGRKTTKIEETIIQEN